MKLHFSLQTHFDSAYFDRLIGFLGNAGDGVDILFDADIPETRYAALAALGPAVRARRSRPIVWCGPSQVHGQIDAIRFALEQPDWEFLINLSGDTAVLRPLDALRDSLREASDAGGRMGIQIWEFKVPLPRIGVYPNGRLSHLRGVARGLVWTTEEIAEEFCAGSPIRNLQKRFALDCADEFEPKRLIVTAPDPELWHARKAFTETVGLHFSRAYYVLHREVCESLVEDYDRGSEAFHLFLTSFEPDETCLPSVAASLGYRDRFFKNEIHFRAGQRIGTKQNRIPEAIERGSFFYRKIDPETYAGIESASS